MGKKIQIDQLAEAVNEQLEEYNKLSMEVVKAAVTKAGNAVKKDIGANAPSKTGRYAKSWRTKKTKESSTALEVTYKENQGELHSAGGDGIFAFPVYVGASVGTRSCQA